MSVNCGNVMDCYAYGKLQTNFSPLTLLIIIASLITNILSVSVHVMAKLAAGCCKYYQILLHNYITLHRMCLQLNINFEILSFNQIALVSCQGLIPTEDNIPCPHDCGPGYKCQYGLCRRQNCTLDYDCSGEPVELVCASNGVTYDSLCELEKARCELEQDIEYYYHGTCMLDDNNFSLLTINY